MSTARKMSNNQPSNKYFDYSMWLVHGSSSSWRAWLSFGEAPSLGHYHLLHCFMRPEHWVEKSLSSEDNTSLSDINFIRRRFKSRVASISWCTHRQVFLEAKLILGYHWNQTWNWLTIFLIVYVTMPIRFRAYIKEYPEHSRDQALNSSINTVLDITWLSWSKFLILF